MLKRYLLLGGLLLITFFIDPQLGQAQTEVTQNISQNTTWTLAGSPYIINPITPILEVENQATLVIEAGVTIKVTNGRAIDVYGRLLAEGRPDAQIIFTSFYDFSPVNIDQPSKGDWIGLKIKGIGSKMQYCQIKYAGKSGRKGYPSASVIIIGQNHLFHHNIIRLSDGNGLLLYTAFGSFRHNLITENNGNGLLTTHSGKSDISYNIIQRNLKNGVILGSFANFRGNIIQLNSANGLVVSVESNNPDIRGNHFDYNQYTGIVLQKPVSSLKLNAITNNQIGVLIEGRVGKIKLEQNDFVDNIQAMQIQGLIPSSSLYRLIQAPNNWWGNTVGPHNPQGEPISDFINYQGWSLAPNTKFLVDQQINPISPNSPSALAVSFDQNRIKLEWKPLSDCDIIAYNIFKSKQAHENFRKIASSTTTYYYDDEFKRGEKYYYKISAVDFSGNESVISSSTVININRLGQNGNFRDVKNTDWYAYYIQNLHKLGFINGYNNQTFRPNTPITRAELLKIVLTAKNIKIQRSSQKIFKDIAPHDWFSTYINTASHLKLINGYKDQTFRPYALISRAEAIALILGKNLPHDYQVMTFKDLDQTPWVKNIANYAVSRGIIKDNLYFRPNDPITRAETCKILSLYLGLS